MIYVMLYDVQVHVESIFEMGAEASDDELDQFPNMTFHFGNATYSWPARGYMQLGESV